MTVEYITEKLEGGGVDVLFHDELDIKDIVFHDGVTEIRIYFYGHGETEVWAIEAPKKELVAGISGMHVISTNRETKRIRRVL